MVSVVRTGYRLLILFYRHLHRFWLPFFRKRRWETSFFLGNLRYYSYVKGLSRVIEGKNCSALLSESPANGQFPTKPPRLPDTTAEALLAIPAFHGCSTMKLQDHVAYCSVFGDPHLITHDGRFQTCRIQGAYPLIENRHLASKWRMCGLLSMSKLERATLFCFGFKFACENFFWVPCRDASIGPASAGG